MTDLAQAPHKMMEKSEREKNEEGEAAAGAGVIWDRGRNTGEKNEK